MSFADFTTDDQLRVMCARKKPFVHVKLMAQDGFAEIIKNYIHKGMSG